ncbi:MAG: hypothetical protein LBE76_04845 [Nitrososphaerota archaeon]|jgi:hypothetical protein|nr:hypothetical protein [Nitrososphaerota archaeon]
MQRQLTKIFVSLFVALIATSSVAILPTNATDKTTNQDVVMNFMKNILPIDLSQYTINIISGDVLQGFPLGDNNRQIHDILYGLISENSEVHISFSFEKGIMTSCLISELKGQKYPQHPVYANTLDAGWLFLKNTKPILKLTQAT